MNPKKEDSDAVSLIGEFEAKNALLRREKETAEKMLEYERNKFKRQLQAKEAGIAEELAEAISLEIQAIRDLCGYITEDDSRRIQRRLQRIDEILKGFCKG